MPATASSIATEMKNRFPIKAAVVNDTNVASGHSFDVGISECQISLNLTAADTEMGRLDSKIHVITREALAGFVGGAYYELMDKQGNIVFAITGSGTGVNGTAIPGAESDKRPVEVRFIPLDVLYAVHSAKASPARLEGDALQRLQDTIDKIVKSADAIKKGLKDMGIDTGALAAALKA